MINFPNNPSFGDAFTLGGTIYTCVSTSPIVWNAAPAAAAIPDAPTDGKTYGRNTAVWKALDKTDVGLDQVDNTADHNKPVSGPQGVALEPKIVAAGTAQYWRGDKTWQILDKNAVQLGSVDNTADANKTVRSALFLRAGGNPVGSEMMFNWSDDGTQPTYLWGGTNANGLVYLTSRVKVGSAGYADNSGACSGLSNVVNARQIYDLRPGSNSIYIGWLNGALDCQVDSSYFGSNWPIGISGTAAYSTGSGTASYCSGTAENANTLNGQMRADACQYVGFASANSYYPYIRCSSGELRYIVHNTNEDRTATRIRVYPSGLNYTLEISGDGGAYGVGASLSDIRLKTNIIPSVVNASAAVEQMEFIEHDWKLENLSHSPLSFSAQNLQNIQPLLVFSVPQEEGSQFRAVSESTEILNPNLHEIVVYLAKALQETLARVAALEAK